MAETILTTAECSWSAVSANILGRKLVGLKGFEVKYSVEKEHVYAAGNLPVDIATGNVAPTGSLKMLKFELDLLNDAALAAGFKNIAEVPHTLISIVIQYKKSSVDKIRTISIPGAAFTEMGAAMDQGAKFTEVSLPFLAMDIIHS